jgi:hypothetical protein
MQVPVRKYRRRHPVPKVTTSNAAQKRMVERAERKLEQLHADENFDDICYVQVSDDDSQVLPGKNGFRRGHCTVVNVERADTADEVEAATTLYHEGLHAGDIADSGENGISKDDEISAHWRTIEFLKMWREREPKKSKRIDEEIQEERESIAYLEAH